MKNLIMPLGAEGYIAAMHTILTHQGWIDCSKAMLAGKTAAAFRFTVDLRLTDESSTAYNWMAEHFLAADFIGITSSQAAGFNFEPIFPLYQKQAISDIQKSLDRGIGCVIWHDRFVVAAGYDDDQQVLYISDGQTREYQLLPYSQFGKGKSPYWHYQILEGRIPLDEIEIYRESLVQAIFKWETHDLMLPKADYACGEAAYDMMINAFQTGNYDPIGAREMINYYAAAKKNISIYIAGLERYWSDLYVASEEYRALAEMWEEAARLLSTSEACASIHKIIDLFSEAKATEAKAIQALKYLLRETIQNRFHDIGLR
ncbi:hypothetical protein [Paenibacillus motobuensis]|uniref:hypothetical protein n=1 Tax=Paenibacillus motobuensis TaxID=295324 RepID=UPI0031D6AF5C